MKHLNRILVALCVAALAIPAAVLAKGPSGTHGKSGDQHGKANKPAKVNKHCKHQPSVGFSLHGTLDPSSTADHIIVVVSHANKHSKPFVTAGKYDLGADSSKATFEGSNPFTTAGADLTKYKVNVGGKVVKLKKGCSADTPPQPTVKKVKVIAPDATTDTPETGQPTTQS